MKDNLRSTELGDGSRGACLSDGPGGKLIPSKVIYDRRQGSAPLRQHDRSPNNSGFISGSGKAADGISYGFPAAFPFLLFLVVIVIYYLWIGMRGFTLPTFEPSLNSWLCVSEPSLNLSAFEFPFS